MPEMACGLEARVTGAYVGVTIFALGLANASCGPRNYYVEHLEIDSTLHIHPMGAPSVLEPSQGSYYFFFNAEVLISVDHFDRNPESERRERLLYFETNRSLLLDRTVKDDEILSGSYGAVYAVKTCFYNRPLQSGYSAVAVGSYLNELGHEIPVELSAPPRNLPPLTSVSLVRIFRTDPEYVIVSANYEPDGGLGSLHVDKTKGGDWVSGVSLLHPDPKQGPAVMYGIPARIDIQQYLRLRRLPIPPSTFPEVIELLNEHYGYNKIIRQDRLSLGVAIFTRFLQPSITQEEQKLNPVCESRFRQQQAAGLPTVD